MAGEQFADLAITSLLSYYESNFATQLRAVETAQSLAVNSLDNPYNYVPGKASEDPQPLLLQVFVDGSGDTLPEATGTDKIVTYPCTLHLEYVGDADIEAGQLRMRRYMTALVNTLYGSRTLGGKVVSAIDAGQVFYAEKMGSAQTRHSIELQVDVTVHEGA